MSSSKYLPKNNKDDDKIICIECDKKTQKDLPATDSVSSKGMPCEDEYSQVSKCMKDNEGQVSSCASQWNRFKHCHEEGKKKKQLLNKS